MLVLVVPVPVFARGRREEGGERAENLEGAVRINVRACPFHNISPRTIPVSFPESAGCQYVDVAPGHVAFLLLRCPVVVPCPVELA